MLIDAHIHIQDIDKNLLGNVQNFLCRQYLMNCSTSIKNYYSLDRSFLASTNIVNFVGFHPWYIEGVTEDELGQLESIVADNRFGIGEVGLDKAVRDVDFKSQKDILIKQLDIADKYSRPVVLHCVKAYGTLFEIIKEHSIDPNLCLVHAFNASLEILNDYANLGVYLSVNVSNYKKQETRFSDIIKKIPKQRLMLETDYPYMLKGDYESSILEYYTACARILNIKYNELIEILYENFMEFNKHIIGE